MYVLFYVGETVNKIVPIQDGESTLVVLNAGRVKGRICEINSQLMSKQLPEEGMYHKEHIKI